MVLCPRCTDRPDRSSHDGNWFPVPRAISIRSGCPVDSVFQHARNGVVVFRSHDQDGIGLPDALLQFNNFGRRILFLVLVEPGYTVQFKSIDCCVFRQSLVASRRVARLYDSRRRLPAIPTMRTVLLMPTPCVAELV